MAREMPVVTAQEVCRQELADIVVRREAAGLLPEAHALAGILRRWVEAGLLPPRALTEVLIRLVEGGKLRPEALKEILNKWDSESPKDSIARWQRTGVLPAERSDSWTPEQMERQVRRLKEVGIVTAGAVLDLLGRGPDLVLEQATLAEVSAQWWPEKLAKVLVRLLDADSLQPDALAVILLRWQKAGLLPADAKEALRTPAVSHLPNLLSDLRSNPAVWDQLITYMRSPGWFAPRALPEQPPAATCQPVPAEHQGSLAPDPASANDPEQLEADAHHEKAQVEFASKPAPSPATPTADTPLLRALIQAGVFLPANERPRRPDHVPHGVDSTAGLVLEALVLEALMREDVSKNLVGVAFSGGGIRSASFNLGVIQALHRSDLLRHVDYLSTVSGGGYVGSHLSSLMLQPDVSPAMLRPNTRRDARPEERFPLQAEPNGAQPPAVIKMIHGGVFLNRPLLFIDRYLIGLFLNNLTLFSGLVFLCVGLAYLWRILDTFPVCESIIWATGGRILDWNRPFLPAAMLFLAWLAAWGIFGWNWIATYAGTFAKVFLQAFSLALVGGLLTLVIKLTEPIKESVENLAGHLEFALWIVLGIAAVSCVLSYGQPLVRAAACSRQTLLLLAGACMLIGAAVWLGNPNINFQNPTAENVPAADVSFLVEHRQFILPLFVLLLVCLVPFLRPRDLLASGAQTHVPWKGWIFRAASVGLLCGIPLGLVFFFARHNFSGRGTRPDRDLVWCDIKDYKKFWQKVSLEDKRSQVPTPLGQARTPGLKILNELQARKDGDKKTARVLDLICPVDEKGDPTGYKKTIYGLEDRLRDVTTLPEWKQIYQSKMDIVAAVNDLFNDEEFNKEFNKEFCKVLRPEDGNEQDGNKQLDKKRLDRLTESEKKEIVRLAELSNLSLTLDKRENKILNHLLLRAYYPDEILQKDKVLRPIVVDTDQGLRLAVLAASAVLFVFCALVVNLNTTSPQSFYRDRLAEAYIVPLGEHGRRIPLALLRDATRKGAPYHLLSATLNALRILEEDISATSSFLFSGRFCGSRATGYQRTETYQSGLKGHLDLPTAMAISGAALSPARVGNPFVAFLMTVMNLRLGQWLPNPRLDTSAGALRPTLARLLFDVLRQRSGGMVRRDLCFVTDGGHNENLGLGQLLRRECSFIIVSDAGQDLRHEFVDFTKLYRRMRLRGLRIQELDSNCFVTLKPLDFVDKDRKQTEHQFLLARILYPSGATGLLIYLKPSLTPTEEIDLNRHRQEHQEFPHDPTLDQLYDADKVESYRQLGNSIGEKLAEKLKIMEIQILNRLLETSSLSVDAEMKWNIASFWKDDPPAAPVKPPPEAPAAPPPRKRAAPRRKNAAGTKVSGTFSDANGS